MQLYHSGTACIHSVPRQRGRQNGPVKTAATGNFCNNNRLAYTRPNNIQGGEESRAMFNAIRDKEATVVRLVALGFGMLCLGLDQTSSIWNPPV